MIVTSGAIGMGAVQLGFKQKVKKVKMRQACAAIGQPMLMKEYRKAFARHHIVIAQVLLTADILDNRKTYLNSRNSLETLLDLGVIPIINENDCISTEEIGSAFGDNDSLGALVASKIDADLLIILSDIDALYDKDPKKNFDAKAIPVVKEITEEIMESAGSSGSTHSTGGMQTKLEAAKIASNAGCRIIIGDGREKNSVTRIMSAEEIGTLFLPKRKLSNKQRWLLNSKPEGTVRIDEGAFEAIKENKNLLPRGIQSIDGNFEAGDVILLNSKAKAITRFSSEELKLLAGKHSTEIQEFIGPGRKSVVANAENIVILD
jgi:glutamate 5-kinase